MEYLEGEPLLSVLRMGREGKRLDVLSTGRLIADTAEGLDAAHELRSMSGDRLELVHHDISLGNIVVLYNGQVKLVDFGVAKATQAGPKSKVQGKFSYMAPEKLKGAPGDRRSDLFSLGCVMWEALTLKRLFRGQNDADTMRLVLEHQIQPPSKINGDVPPEYDPIVMRALERDPEKRQRTAKELAVEIEELLRKRGYGAKNDRIARYMQDTFKSHIDARKKLVQEVVAKGSASAEVLDAAFSEPLASGSPVNVPAATNEFSLRYRRATPPAGYPAQKPGMDPMEDTRIEQRGAHPMFDESDIQTGTELMPMPELEGQDSKQMEITRPSISIGDRVRAVLSDQEKRFYAIAGVVAFLLVILIVVLLTRHRDEQKPVVASEPTKPAPEKDQTAVTPDAGDEIEIFVDAPTAPKPKHEEPKHEEPKHEEPKHEVPPTPPTPPPPPKIDVQDTVKQALMAYVKGDSGGALSLLQKAKAAKPGYAPTYRVLGKVYQKQGNRAAAKSAFQRYLQLAPDADDAAQIREELKSL